MGISISYDNLFSESCRCLALRGVELIIAPYATPIADPWEDFLTTRALEEWGILGDLQSCGPGGGLADVRQKHDHLSLRQDCGAGQ